MSPEEYVTALYRLCLGREPDPEGMAAWTAALEADDDPTAVMAGFLGSEEAQARRGEAEAVEVEGGTIEDLAARAAARLGRRPRIVDVGALSLGEGTHPYSPLIDRMPVDIVGFDPQGDRLRERAASETVQGSVQLLPFAVGDGKEHTLYVNDDDATTSLFPLDAERNAAFNHLATLHTVREEEIVTKRLDDVLPAGPIDFLKLDVQGAELMVLQGGPASVQRTAVVHCEVEFSPIYVGQPLYPTIQIELGAAGFELIDLLVPARYHYLTGSGRATPDQLIWADAVFFRETDEPETLAVQALIAAAIYRKPTLAEHLLGRAEARSR